MTITAPPAVRPLPAPPAAPDDLAPWERDALKKLRLLRAGRKPGMLVMFENGSIVVFRGERAGVIAP